VSPRGGVLAVNTSPLDGGEFAVKAPELQTDGLGPCEGPWNHPSRLILSLVALRLVVPTKNWSDSVL